MKHMKNHRAICLETVGCRAAGARHFRKSITGGRLSSQNMHTNAERWETTRREWSSTSSKTMALLQWLRPSTSRMEIKGVGTDISQRCLTGEWEAAETREVAFEFKGKPFSPSGGGALSLGAFLATAEYTPEQLGVPQWLSLLWSGDWAGGFPRSPLAWIVLRSYGPKTYSVFTKQRVIPVLLVEAQKSRKM